MKQQNNTRANNFALLHLLGATMVIWGHSTSMLEAARPQLLGTTVHAIGVNILLCISGYLVSGSYRRSKRVSDFFKKRIMRLFPPLWLVLIFTVFVLGFVTDTGGNEYISGAWYYLSRNAILKINYNLPGVFAENPYPNAVNGSLWSLPYEMLLYLALPLLFLFSGKKCNKRAVVTGGIVYAMTVCLHVFLANGKGSIHLLLWSFSRAELSRLAVFFFAGYFYSCLPRNLIDRFCQVRFAFPLLIAGVFCGNYYPAIANDLLLPYIAITVALNGKLIANHFFNSLDIAYEIYLYGFLIQQLIVYILVVKLKYTALTPQLLFLISFPVIVVLSYAANKLVKMIQRKPERQSGER